MALPSQTQVKYWAVIAVVFAAALWFLGPVLTPFVLGGAFAYLLDPVADRFERLGCSRVIATVLTSLLAGFVVIFAALLVVPTLVQQAIALFESAPETIRNLQATLTERFPSLLDGGSVLRQSLTRVGELVQERGGQLVSTLLSSVSGIVNVLVLVVVVPVVAFYLLLDWDKMVARIDDLLPLDHRSTIREIASEIDNTLSSFLRGQGTVCLIMGVYYAVALMLAGLNFGLIVGFIAGIITFIPYVGAIVGGALAIGLALFQFLGPETLDGEVIRQSTDWLRIGIVAAIFFAGQFFEGNILTPNLVGSSVGLHPVWLIFALSVFGAIFGFIGMLVAVPVAAVIGVLARFLIKEYKTGLLYRGLSAKDDE